MNDAAPGLPTEGDGDVEKESFDKTGLRSDVVTLYQGGQYVLYTYKKYVDVRLVFAPNSRSPFGGDPDNFEFLAMTSTSASSAATRMRATGPSTT